MSTSFYVIEDSLQQLADLREQAEAEGDSEALKVIDVQIGEYLLRESDKISSYVGLIQLREDQELNCDREIDRWTGLRKKARADKERLKATALAVMQRFDVKALKDERTGQGFRRQGNSGLQPLEITETPWILPNEFKRYKVRLSAVQMSELMKALGESGMAEVILTDSVVEADTEAIRKALAMRVTCPECKGNPNIPEPTAGETYLCPRCSGAGTIPNSIPGARLLERGEQVRIL
jgi:hypothetical protein